MSKKDFVKIVVFLFVSLLLSTNAVYAQADLNVIENPKKLGQTGMQFLTVPVNPRAAALAGAMTATESGGSVSLFYNPATMTNLSGTADLSFAQSKWIADIDYNQAGAAFKPAGGRYGVIGLSFLSVDYGSIQETVRADNESGYLDIGTYQPTAMAIGLGYARSLTNIFDVGGQVKYVTQSLGQSPMSAEVDDATGDVEYVREGNSVNSLAFDFGVVYRTGFRSLVLAMDVRNFSQEITYRREEFELPLVFQIGVSMDVMDLTNLGRDMHGLVLYVDASHPRSYSEQLKLGAEYLLANTLALRAGYRYPTDEPEFNVGIGVQQKFGNLGFSFDYAYTQFGVFGNINRLGVGFTF